MNAVFSLSPYEPGSVAVSSSKKSYSRGFLHRLFSCLCNKDAKPPPVKINAPLSLEENRTKVSASFSPLPCSSLRYQLSLTLPLDHLWTACGQHDWQLLDARNTCFLGFHIGFLAFMFTRASLLGLVKKYSMFRHQSWTCRKARNGVNVAEMHAALQCFLGRCHWTTHVTVAVFTLYSRGEF